jgi:multidrug resistance efflux pump
MLLFMLMLLLFGLAYNIKYPDVVRGEIKLSTEIPPIPIINNTSGYVQQLFIKNNDTIKVGAILAIIDNIANSHDIFAIDSLLQLSDSLFLVALAALDSSLFLGDIHPEYNQLMASYNNYKTINKAKNRSVPQQLLRGQISEQAKQDVSYEKQIMLQRKDLNNTKMRVENTYKMLQSGIVSKLEYERVQAEYLQKQQGLESALLSRQSNQQRKLELGNQITIKNYDNTNEVEAAFLKLNESKSVLQSRIDWWRKTYTLVAPMAGTVNMTEIWAANQYVKQGESNMTIIPPSNAIVATMYLPKSGSANVKTNQAVQIKLNNFPEVDYGYLNGTVNSISQLPDAKGNYSIKVKLTNGITTSTKTTLPYAPLQDGTAEVITDKKSVLERILNKTKMLL